LSHPPPRSARSPRPTDKAAPPVDDIAAELSAAGAALDQGAADEALVRHRALAKKHPTDSRVQRAWAESAAAARDWKEAVDASETWALLDNTVEPRLYLARMLVYSGRRKAAIRILENVIEAHPESDEARALLRDYRGDEPPSQPSTARAERHDP